MPTFYALPDEKIPSIKNGDYSIIGTYVKKFIDILDKKKQKMKAHTQQTRMEAIRLYTKESKSLLWISKELNISYTSLRTWLQRYESDRKSVV